MYITCNRAGVEYDIHSLVKSFYPSEEIKVVSPAAGTLPEGIAADMEIITGNRRFLLLEISWMESL